MGARTDAWPKERLAGMAAFFSQIGYKSTGEWKEEIVYFDPDKPLAGRFGGRAARSARFQTAPACAWSPARIRGRRSRRG